MLTILRQIAQALAWLVVVAPWEQALRVRLGKHAANLGPGIYLRIPFVDRVFKQSVRRRIKIIRPQTVTTSDGRTITCVGAIGFEIGDLRKFYNALESPNDTLENEAARLVARFIGKTLRLECTAPAVETYVRDFLDLTLFGLSGQEFYITSFAEVKTYRFITGEMATYHCDGQISMTDVVQAASALL